MSHVFYRERKLQLCEDGKEIISFLISIVGRKCLSLSRFSDMSTEYKVLRLLRQRVERVSRYYLPLCILLITVLLASCDRKGDVAVDALNEKAYYYHYRNLDSTRIYAESALQLSIAEDYSDGHAEALNNLAFVETAAMNYGKAERYLEAVADITDNQLELLVAGVQQMKLCQKQSRNQDFYTFREIAEKRLSRIHAEESSLSEHEQKRLTYARSEYYIVSSAYYYYVGLSRQAIKMLNGIDPYGEIERDTAQLLNYWYNIGAGGVITDKDKQKVAEREFEYLIDTYSLAQRAGFPYWQAQALQAMSEHLQDPVQRDRLIRDNYAAIVYVNTDNMPDSLLAGNLAQRALSLFSGYGDVYQTAGAYRTLAECYWHIGDDRSALICLNRALDAGKDSTKHSKTPTPQTVAMTSLIAQAPDLVASIREDLCLVYSAVNDKRNSDLNRNIYLDLQEETRQDRLLEARAAQLDNSVRWLNIMIATVAFMIVLVIVLLIIFARMRRRSDSRFSINSLLSPLSCWQKQTEAEAAERREHYEEIVEQADVARLHIRQNEERNLEQRAKVQLVVSIMPLIDRMRNEVRRLTTANASDGIFAKKTQTYIAELCDSINDYNNVLTQWIQMRQGDLSLRIESFPLQSVFDIVAHSSTGFALKGITLKVMPTDVSVKADKTLTLFMVNTIADNARKFTPKGGTVIVKADEKAEGTSHFVEISITDNGPGMTEETIAHVFDRTYTGGHGFGLKNCKGIIEKYKKISSIFNICDIKAESPVAESPAADSVSAPSQRCGTRIFFRLPLGRLRMVIATILLLAASFSARAASKASAFADSAYLSNLMGNYETTLRYADSCHKYVSPSDTAIILDISNETAVAALALHRWQLYRQQNEVYTRLFREASADSSLPSYVRAMQRSKTNRTVAVVLLVMMLLVIFPAYYFLYYRHKLNYKFCVERIERMNIILLSDVSDEEKLKGIESLADFSRFHLTIEQKGRLKEVVERIIDALQQNIRANSVMDTEAELATDECHRLELDNSRLHVSNSVLDNCLSTLKHETMYYPSRIRQMIVHGDVDLGAVGEIINYYHDLYAILAEQALRQVVPQRITKDTVAYMFEILKRCNNGKPVAISTSLRSETPDGKALYVEAAVTLTDLVVPDEKVAQLFTPFTANLDFMLVRQIVREMGEATNLRACGVSAEKDGEGAIVVHILMPRRFLPEATNSKPMSDVNKV
jgi:signal transduction histidine kinase